MDGAFPFPPYPDDMPEPTCDASEMWRWASSTSDVEFMLFDVKYFSLRAGSLKQLDFAWSSVSKDSWTEQATIYLIAVQGQHKAIGIVPAAVFEQSTDFAHGLNPLLSGSPAWLHPFMVETEHLSEAMSRLFAAARSEDTPYVNPTTGTQLVGFKPHLSVAPPL